MPALFMELMLGGLHPWGLEHISGCEGEAGESGTTSDDDMYTLCIHLQLSCANRQSALQ